MLNNLWQQLTPHNILNSIESAIKQPLSNICIQRNSYINRVYEIEIKQTKERFIVKFYRPERWSQSMILEEHEFLHYLTRHDMPVIAPLLFNKTSLFTVDSIHFALFPKKWGRHVNEFSRDQWTQIGRLMGRLHQLAANYKPIQRQTWTPEQVTEQHLSTIVSHHVCPSHFIKTLETAVHAFIKAAQPHFHSTPLQLCHGDCHFGNIIDRENEGLFLVDFDDMIIAPPIQDIWMYLPDPSQRYSQFLEWFQEGYCLFQTFPSQQFHLIPYLATMRQIHFAAWCAVQSKEAFFQHYFPTWGDTRYWNELIKDISQLT